jgi:transcriptional regulator with XRE-family HTH domain
VNNGLYRSFGDRLRELRLAAGISQEELAHRARLHRTYLGGIERGERNPSLANLHKLAQALGVDLATLFEGVK